MTTDTIIKLGGVNSQLIKYGEPWRIFTAMWLHNSFIHILMNMCFLYFIGRDLELIFGHWRFLVIFLISGIVGDATAGVFSKSNVVSAGASSALFGLLGAGLVLVLFNAQYRYVSSQLLGIFFANIILNLTDPSISLSAHLGGCFSGILCGLLLTPTAGLITSLLIRLPLTIAINYILVTIIFKKFLN